MPLTFDLPIEQLKTYPGKNPCPTDFDSFWDRSLAEMRSIDPEIELIAAEFTAPNSGDWFDKLGYASAGFTVAALDCRGQAGLSDDRGSVAGNTHHGQIIRGLNDALQGSPQKLLFQQIFLDTAQLASIVMDMPDVDANRVGVTGCSQGGALAVACAALEPRIKRAAPLYPFLSDYIRVWDMDQAKDAYKELQELFRQSDPMHQRESIIFEKLGYRYSIPGSSCPGKGTLGNRPDGHNLSSFHAVHCIQQAYVA